MAESLNRSQFKTPNKQQINLVANPEDFESEANVISQRNEELLKDLHEYDDNDDRVFQSKITRTTQIRKIKKPEQQSQFKPKDKKEIKGDVQHVQKRVSLDQQKFVQNYNLAEEDDVRKILDDINFQKQSTQKSNFQKNKKKVIKNTTKVLKREPTDEEDQKTSREQQLLSEENFYREDARQIMLHPKNSP